MMVICKSQCSNNKNRACTLDIIRLDSSGRCEQCDLDVGFEADTLISEVERVLVKHGKQKAPRHGNTR